MAQRSSPKKRWNVGEPVLRYDTKVYFWNDADKKYNPHTHKYETGTVLAQSKIANVTDLGLDKQVRLLGGIKTGTKTVRLPLNDLSKWSYMTFDSEGKGTKYRFVSSLDVLKGYAMIVGTDNG